MFSGKLSASTTEFISSKRETVLYIGEQTELKVRLTSIQILMDVMFETKTLLASVNFVFDKGGGGLHLDGNIGFNCTFINYNTIEFAI